MSKNPVKEVRNIVEKACAADSNIFGYGIWTHHITKAAEIGKQWASEFNADPEIVELAALLHDYASVKDEALYAEHHIHGPLEAGQILTGLNYPPEKTEQVKEAIAKHRASVENKNRSAEAECLANADAASHIENVPSLVYLAYVQHGMDIDEGAAWVRAKLERSWNKMDTSMQNKLKNKYRQALSTLTDCLR